MESLCPVCLVRRPLTNLPILKREVLGMAYSWMAWGWPNRQRTPWGILSAPTYLPIVTGEMRSSGWSSQSPFQKPGWSWGWVREARASPHVSVRGRLEKRIWIWMDFSNSPWNQWSKISESEELRDGQSSTVALGKWRKRRQDRYFKGKQDWMPETRQGQHYQLRAWRPALGQHQTWLYMQCFGKEKLLNKEAEWLRKKSPDSPPNGLLPVGFSLQPIAIHSSGIASEFLPTAFKLEC